MGGLLFAAVLAGCDRGQDASKEVGHPTPTAASNPTRVAERQPATVTSPTFVGSQTCEPCHAGETRLWRGSHHDLAMQEATSATVLGNFDAADFSKDGVTSTFFRRDDQFLVRTDGPDGTLQEYEVAYTFGVDPLQQYLIRFPGGRLQSLGIAWDARPAAHGGQRWFHLYPNEKIAHDDPLHWTGSNQNWNFMCAECHSTNLRKNYRPETDTYDTSWSEIDVACEACHGPGSQHLAWAERQSAEAGVHNPSKNSPLSSPPRKRLSENTLALSPPREREARRPGETWIPAFETVDKLHFSVIPAKAGIQETLRNMDSRVRGNDDRAGPGSQHRAWAKQPSTETANKGLAVRLGSEASWVFDAGAVTARRSQPLPSHAEVETCGRCHARRSVLREAYVHGRPLADTHMPALLDEGLYHVDGQILEEVYVYGSFLQSKMYAAGVSCRDCHEPHSLELRAEGNAVCANCHQPAHFDTPGHHFHAASSPGASCVECHMPSSTYMVVDPRRDHSLRVPRPDLSVRLGTPNACNACHRDRSPEWAADAVQGWYGKQEGQRPHYAEALNAGRRNLPGAEAALAALVSDRTEPAIVRATALRQLARHLGPRSISTVQQALGDPDPLVRAAAIEAADRLPAEGRIRLIRPLLDDPVLSVRLTATATLALVPTSLWNPSDSSARDAATSEYIETQRQNSDRPEAYLNLGLLYAGLDQFDAARAAYEQAIRIDARFVPAYANLADLYRVRGEDEEGERVLRRALEVAPESGELHHSLGLLLTRRKRISEALPEFRRAIEIDPDQPRYAYVYGVALHSAGYGERALGVLSDGHERNPGDRDLLTALATISRDEGATDEAIRYARLLQDLSPDDPSARQLLQQLEQQKPTPSS